MTGTAGTVSTWDLVSATSVLDLTTLSIGSKFNINLYSLSSIGPDVNGIVAAFNNTQNYKSKIATAAGGIDGFNSSYFNLNTGSNNGTAVFARKGRARRFWGRFSRRVRAGGYLFLLSQQVWP